jgi:hypothetical protein
MKKLFSILTALLVIGFMTNISAQSIKWSGDLQVRPRYDMLDWGEYGKSGIGKINDMYYMMRARLNVAVDIDENWVGKIQLAHYNYAGYYFTNAAGLDGTAPVIGSNDLLSRPAVNFTQMWFGYHGKAFGLDGGIIPLNALKNPMLDVQFYPGSPIDIPFTIRNLGSATGFKGYINPGFGKIHFMAVLNENYRYIENLDGSETDLNDVYTYGFDYEFKLGGFMLQPAFYMTVANDSAVAPMTYGLNLGTPKFAGFAVNATFAMFSNSATGTTEFDGMYFRFKITGKLGPGKVIAWYDYAKRTDKYSSGDVDETYGYIWVAYAVGINKHVTVMPRARIISDKVDNSKDFSRNKLELLFIAKF